MFFESNTKHWLIKTLEEKGKGKSQKKQNSSPFSNTRNSKAGLVLTTRRDLHSAISFTNLHIREPIEKRRRLTPPLAICVARGNLVVASPEKTFTYIADALLMSYLEK